MRALRYVFALTLLGACDDHEFKSEGEAVEGKGLSAVLDVMDGNCVGCHTGASASVGLDLTRDLFCDSVLDGRLVIPGDAAGSILQQRIEGIPSSMPPTGPMDPGNIAIVADWIDAGADCSGEGGDDSSGEDTGGDDSGGDDSGGDSAGDDGGTIDGAQVYADSCSGCHGANGEGVSGPNMGYVVPGLTEAEIADIALNGSAGGGMPGILSDGAAADAVAAYCVDTWGP